jgi:ABC-type amino acid transport substrate-binding protein
MPMAFKAVNVDVTIEFFPAPRMVQVVDSGQAVCGIGGTILFSEPAVAANTRISSKIQYVLQTFLYDSRRYPNGIQYERLEDMQKYKIGVLNGSGIMRLLARVPNLTLVVNTKHAYTAKQLSIGRVDVWAIVDLTGFQIMRQLYPAEAKYYKITKQYHIGDVSFVCSKKADPHNIYSEKFKKGFEIIKRDGTYMKIMTKYYGHP